MGQPAAKQGDKVTGVCTHTELVNQPAGPPVAVPFPSQFNGVIDGGLSSNVRIMKRYAATQDSTATNTPSHHPMAPPAPGSVFKPPMPTNKASINKGSSTVNINGKPAARFGDTAKTCDELQTLGTVVAAGSVNIGG